VVTVGKESREAWGGEGYRIWRGHADNVEAFGAGVAGERGLQKSRSA
jgi:hypothetical protein